MKPNTESPSTSFPRDSGSAKIGVIPRILYFLSQSPFLTSFLIAASLLTLNMIFFRPHFQLNDDTSALLLFKGVGLDFSPAERTEMQTVCLGFVLKALYSYIPGIQWYSVLFVFSLLLSVWSILFAFLLGSHRFFRASLFLISSIAILCFYLTDLQFTQIATFSAEAAFLLLAGFWKSENPRFSLKVFSMVLILVFISTGIRLEGFLLMALVSIPFAIYLAWKKEITALHRSILRFGILLMVFILIILGFHHVYYNRGPWEPFNEVHSQIADLHENRYTEYNQATKPIFDSVGWTPLDLQMFLSWYFMDENTYSYENFKKLNGQLPKANKYSQNTFSAMLSSLNVWIVALFLFALLLFLPARIFPYVSLYGLWIFLIWLFLMFYLRMPERVFLPPLLFLKDMVIFYAVPKNKGQGETRTTSTWTFKGGVVSLVLLSFFTFFFLQKEFAKNKNWSYNESVLNASTAGFHPQDNQLYVIWDSAFPFELMGAFDDFELFRHFHVVMLAGHQRSPQAHSMMTHFGVKNLFRDLVDNPDLFLICSRYEMDLYKAHMREKHQMETDFEAVFTSPFFAAYRIHSVKTAVSSTSKKD